MTFLTVPDNLLIKDSGTYVEVIVDKFNFKRHYTSIQKIVLKKAVNNKRVNMHSLFDEYEEQILLFYKYLKCGSSNQNQDKYNQVLTKIKGYKLETNKKCYQYFNHYCYVNMLELCNFNIKIDKDYGLNLISKILHDYGFIKHMIVNYLASKYIKHNSRLRQILKINKTVKLSLFYIKKILVHLDYEI